jgi:TolB-like protein
MNLYAQKAPTLPNIAVIPFAGDENVTPQQLNFLSGKFAGELIATNAFRVLDRGKMEFILKEQGFQQTGACNSSECQVQMGQLLGVDNIVAGNLVRFGRKYAFRADYIDVGSGQVLFTAEVSESGELEDVYELLCQGAAKNLAKKFRSTQVRATPKPVAPVVTAPAEPEPAPEPTPVIPAEAEIQDPAQEVPADALPTIPSKPISFKRKVALALWGGSLLGAGGGYYFDGQGVKYLTDFNAAKSAGNRTDLRDAAGNVDDSKTYRSASLGLSVGTALIGLVLWFLPEGK